ncbi:MAG: TrmB family transcriptional regulator [Promethearchaeota archaeon]
MKAEDQLIALGWNKNDAKVYCALIELGLASAHVISKETGIDRTRVYDSLKRLTSKGYVKKEQKEWGGKYEASRPDLVIQQEISTISTKLKIAKETLKYLKELEKKRKDETRIVWAIQGKKDVREIIEKFIKSARKRILWLQSPDIFGPPVQHWAFYALVKAAKKNSISEIIVSLQVNDTNKHLVEELINNDIKIYIRQEQLLPLALLIVDEVRFIQLSISKFEPLPEYNFGIYGENVLISQMQGLEYLFDHILKDHKRIKKGDLKNLNL